MFQHIPFLNEHLSRLETIINDFKQYKMSVPTYGAILMTPDKKRVLLVQSYWAKSSWGFPKGKVNEDEDPLHCAIREVSFVGHCFKRRNIQKCNHQFRYTRKPVLTRLDSSGQTTTLKPS